ncbi:hypothetical protein D7X55_15540 [Corallococcus sp. AB049A]|uniref:Uncharacterized protein n=1 Tax=Corallococcus interemptor TaxID=2316720 RepID=A0A3A8QXU6_9BACT|nr:MULTISPECIES: hypothetical protein [Corallococcus]RKH52135.1 hypothetical protein D7Y23_07935 [Corallococcus sp. AB050B]RKH72601.1 hypothetical protein D7X96_04200 [Corallococcus interemptor]RKI65991.1 hypothetical protein D7X55_15540 [Corallococcus sp. AB049A]
MNPTPDDNTESLREKKPRLSTQEEVERHSAYQALQRSERPSYWGIDLDPARRPGVPMTGHEPRPMPHARFPPERQQGTSASPMHGRPNKPMPPVFGTATPLHGVSGLIRRAAYRKPDHDPSHWLLKMFADRVDSWGYHTGKVLKVVGPVAVVALLVGLARERSAFAR